MFRLQLFHLCGLHDLDQSLQFITRALCLILQQFPLFFSLSFHRGGPLCRLFAYNFFRIGVLRQSIFAEKSVNFADLTMKFIDKIKKEKTFLAYSFPLVSFSIALQ
jgi:hypothetical protein